MSKTTGKISQIVGVVIDAEFEGNIPAINDALTVKNGDVTVTLSGIADMGVVIDRRPADIEGHPLRVARLEHALFAAKGVMDRQRHRVFRDKCW